MTDEGERDNWVQDGRPDWADDKTLAIIGRSENAALEGSYLGPTRILVAQALRDLAAEKNKQIEQVGAANKRLIEIVAAMRNQP